MMEKYVLSFSLILTMLFVSVDNAKASTVCRGSPAHILSKTHKNWHNCEGEVRFLGYSVSRNYWQGLWKNGGRTKPKWCFKNGYESPPTTTGCRCYDGGDPLDNFDNLYECDDLGEVSTLQIPFLQKAFKAQPYEIRKVIQQNLKELRYYEASVDGLFGKKTRSALTEYNNKFLGGANLKKSENVDKLLASVIDHRFSSRPDRELPEKIIVDEPPITEVKPKTPSDTKTTSDPVTVIPAEEGPKRDFKKEFGLSLYGSFLHSEKAPKTLFFFSDIEKNDSFEFRKALRNHDIDLVVLSSPGGLVWEGLSIAGIIHDKKLNTYIPKNSLKGKGNCASACSFMFFAGEEKAVNGMLGVHQFYSGDSSKKAEIGDAQKSAQFTVSEIIGFLNEFGTPPWVYERMFQQSNMYYFKEDELLQLETETTELQAVKFREIETFISNLSGAFNGTDE